MNTDHLQSGTHRPSFGHRLLNQYSVSHNDLEDWAAQQWFVANHINGLLEDHALPAVMGGSVGYISPPGFVHTSFILAPPLPTLNNTHPEWFGGWHAASSQPLGQLCWSNASLVQYLIKQVRMATVHILNKYITRDLSTLQYNLCAPPIAPTLTIISTCKQPR